MGVGPGPGDGGVERSAGQQCAGTVLSWSRATVRWRSLELEQGRSAMAVARTQEQETVETVVSTVERRATVRWRILEFEQGNSALEQS